MTHRHCDMSLALDLAGRRYRFEGVLAMVKIDKSVRWTVAVIPGGTSPGIS